MAGSSVFSFGDQSVAHGYDTVLTPLMFGPWAAMLVQDFTDWQGRHVLDLATGTGIVAHKVAREVGAEGKVLGTDINNEMLDLARQRCAECDPPVKFIESPAHPLNLPSGSVDMVVCQQGFQFFPDKSAAAQEMFRVLRSPGQLILTTWCPLGECEFFGRISEALRVTGQRELAEMIRTPFDFMPESDLESSISGAGFENVEIRKKQSPLIISDGREMAMQVAYATPIGPKLRELSEEEQQRFCEKLEDLIEELSPDGITMGLMTSNVLTAEKTG
jgi:ubiquinone/menaquinone biosynthesis C-methylase UbiE